MMHWLQVYGLIFIGVAIGVIVMAIVAICRERDEPKAPSFDNDQVNGEEY